MDAPSSNNEREILPGIGFSLGAIVFGFFIAVLLFASGDMRLVSRIFGVFFSGLAFLFCSLLAYSAFCPGGNKEDVIPTRTSPSDVETLFSMLNEAREWGRDNGWPMYENYPQYEQIRVIGEMFDRRGGRGAMQQAHESVAIRDPELGSMLEALWDGVGKWRW
jgi:hypothetical protein